MSDPTRRKMLDLLAQRGSLTVGQLASEFPNLVPSGISKHLMVLRQTGLVIADRIGREKHYRIDANAFSAALTPWLAKYEAYWASALEKLRDLSDPG